MAGSGAETCHSCSTQPRRCVAAVLPARPPHPPRPAPAPRREQGYWEDIGTVRAFYESNLALTDSPNPNFSFYDKDAPIYTMSRFLPPSKVGSG